MNLPPPPHDGSWSSVNWTEVLGIVASSAVIGLTRAMYLIRRGRKFRWLDIALEPSLAVFAGMLVYLILSATQTPDVVRAAFVSLGAWGGPKTIHWAELKLLGGTRATDSGAMPLGKD